MMMFNTTTGAVQKDESVKPSAKMLGLLKRIKTQNERTYQEKVQKWNLHNFEKQHPLLEKQQAQTISDKVTILDSQFAESINNRQVDMV